MLTSSLHSGLLEILSEYFNMIIMAFMDTLMAFEVQNLRRISIFGCVLKHKAGKGWIFSKTENLYFFLYLVNGYTFVVWVNLWLSRYHATVVEAESGDLYSYTRLLVDSALVLYRNYWPRIYKTYSVNYNPCNDHNLPTAVVQ